MTVDDRERLEQLFHSQIAAGVHHGAELCVYRDGERVLDLAGGTTGPDGDDMDPDRRMVFFSSTKPLTGACVHQLAERGGLEYDDPIVAHWPGFAEEGTQKADVTVRHVLSHQGGFPRGPFDERGDLWTDWDAVVEAMEEIECSFEPGSTAAYHALNYGWVLGELVRRVSGQPVGEYLREHVLEPLGMTETYLGLPADVEDDVATLVAFDAFDRCRDPGGGLDTDYEAAATGFNTEAYHRAVMPAANGVGTARDLARFYAAMGNGGAIDGTRVLEEATVEEATSVQIAVDRDGTLGIPIRWAMGFARAGTVFDRYGTLSPEGTFGHGGLGSSIGWVDPDAGLAMAYITNGMRDPYEHRARCNAIADGVRTVFG